MSHRHTIFWVGRSAPILCALRNAIGKVVVNLSNFYNNLRRNCWQHFFFVRSKYIWDLQHLYIGLVAVHRETFCYHKKKKLDKEKKKMGMKAGKCASAILKVHLCPNPPYGGL